MGLISLPIALGAVASHRRPAAAWTAGGISLVVLVMDVSLTNPGLTVGEILRTTAILILLILVGILVGFNTRSARLRLKAMELRSARMALASEQAVLLAAAEERSRIAREMHDVVAHSLAVMITMADGAAATVERDPATAKQAMETLAEAGRSALADTRRLVGVLREDPSVQRQATPPPEPPAPSGGSPSSAHQHEVRDLPVPEFAPLGTVTPVEPSAPIANLRQQATDGAGDRSRGDLPLAPSPEQADITELVKRFVAAGVPVTYRWVGAALPDGQGPPAHRVPHRPGGPDQRAALRPDDAGRQRRRRTAHRHRGPHRGQRGRPRHAPDARIRQGADRHAGTRIGLWWDRTGRPDAHGLASPCSPALGRA